MNLQRELQIAQQTVSTQDKQLTENKVSHIYNMIDLASFKQNGTVSKMITENITCY